MRYRSLTFPYPGGKTLKNKDFRSWLVMLKTLADDGHGLPPAPEPRSPVVY